MTRARHNPGLPAGRTAGAGLLQRLPTWPVCLAVYAGSVAALLLSPMGRGWPFVDLGVYRLGGQALLGGAHLYALRFPGALAFTYPPAAAIAFAPLAHVQMRSLELAVSACNLALLPLMLRFALQLRPRPVRVEGARAASLSLLCAAATVWLEPVWTTLRYGQIDILIATLILYDLSRPDSARGKGAAIGLASGLKLTPAIFIVYLLLTRRARAAAVSASVFAATVLGGFALARGDSSEFWGGAFIDPQRVGRIENAANQSLRGAYARLLHSTAIMVPWLLTAALVGVLGIVLAARAGRRGDEVRGFSLCALTGLLISPISWSHHWVLAVPALMLLALAMLTRPRPAGVIAATLAAGACLLHIIWWVPVNHPEHSELHLAGLQLLDADAYVLLGAAALAAAAFAATRPALTARARRRALRRRAGLPAASSVPV